MVQHCGSKNFIPEAKAPKILFDMIFNTGLRQMPAVTTYAAYVVTAGIAAQRYGTIIVVSVHITRYRYLNLVLHVHYVYIHIEVLDMYIQLCLV